MFFFISFIFFLIVVTLGTGNNKQGDYKRGVIKTIFAWLLMILAFVGFIKDLIFAFSLESFDKFFNNLPFTALIFLWSLYIFNCGPMYPTIWKRVVKTILYFIFSVLFGFVSYLPFEAIFHEPMIVIIPMILFLVIGVIILKMNYPSTELKKEE